MEKNKKLKKNDLVIGRPSTIKNLDRVSLSLSKAEKLELKRQSNLSGCASISHYLRKLIEKNKNL